MESGVQVRSLALGLTGESVITDSARREAGAEAARGGAGEPKALSSWRSAIAMVLGEESRTEGGRPPCPLTAERPQAHSWPPGPRRRV